MGGLRVQLFGRLQIWRDGGQIDELEAKARELFSYLLVYRERAHPRDTLAELLWADTVPERLRKYLRQTLWQLQAAVGGGVAGGVAGALRVDSEWVQVDPDASIWLDVAELEGAFLRTRGFRGRSLNAEQADELRRAIALYRGDLLEGWYQEWCLFERERLQTTYLTILDKLMEYAEHVGAQDEGIDYGNAILRHDRARERTHRRLMRLHAGAGDRTGALRQFERCVAALRDELEVQPSPRTLALLAQIRADQFPSLAAGDTPAPTGSAQQPASEAAPDVLRRLLRLEGTLASFQHDLHQDIVALNQALHLTP
jgi:DNA-binding SARP family transcriptional activator